MKLEEVFQTIIDGRALLITGSGAHIDVKTPDGTPFPSGINLAKAIYASCGIKNPENPYDLQDATDTFLEKESPEQLIVELKKNLMVGKIQPSHEYLYSQPWKRVYTTNYDNVPLVATKKMNSTLFPVTLSSKLQNDWENIRHCVYINGYIDSLNKNTLKSEFRLSGESYSNSNVFDNSTWSAIFAEDIETTDCIVIVGLSLEYDLDIKRFIYNQNVIDKTVFIEQESISEDKKRKMNRLGKVYPINMENFVKQLVFYEKNHQPQQISTKEYIYRSFDVNEEKVIIKKSAAQNVYNLFMFGITDDSLWYREKGKYVNLVYRKSLQKVIDALNGTCRVIYLHANLGNGKTLFAECLKHKMQKSDYHIYTLKEFYQSTISNDIQHIINSKGKKLIIIENYYNYISILEKFSLYNLKHIKFILTSRTVLYDARIVEANECLKIGEGQSCIIDLNKLELSEIKEMNQILSKNGLWGKLSKMPGKDRIKHLRNKQYGNSEFQGILVYVLQSTNMKKKIEEIVSRIKNLSHSYYESLILLLLVKIMSLDINSNDINRIMGINIGLDVQFIRNRNVQEILEFTSGYAEFKVKSAATANMILKELNCNDTIIKVLTLTAKFADRYHNLHRYENILKNIISYSHVKTFLLKSKQTEAFLINYYDSLKELEYYKENTFFWLQYAISCSNLGKYELAQTYLDSAYSYFRHSEYTVPFQVDTQQARLYFLQIENDGTSNVTDLFEKAHRLLMKPVTSCKDNEEKQLYLLKYYVKKTIQKRLPDNFKGIYREYCEEAYNKMHQYLKKKSIKSNYNNVFNQLEKNLLRESVPSI